MLVIALTTIIIGENDFNAMEDWGLEREEWFRGVLELPNGIPDKDAFRRLFERIRPEELLKGLTQWLVGPGSGREVNIDGNTLRGSGKVGSHDALHVNNSSHIRGNSIIARFALRNQKNMITGGG
jgi:hypothetical protein